MNRLNKIILSFVLLFFCLLISVSYAYIDTGESISYVTNFSETEGSPGGLNFIAIRNAFVNYLNDPSDITNQQNYEATLSNLSNVGYENVYIFSDGSTNYLYLGCIIYPNEVEILVNKDDPLNYFYINCPSGLDFYYKMPGSGILYKVTSSTSQAYRIGHDSGYQNVAYTDYTSIKYVDVVTANKTLVFNGDYLYNNGADEPDTPSLPSNQEIASAVQAFYNSDYYKNNKDFEDFLVLYNTKTGYFSFVGHNFGNKLGQQIIDPDVSVGSPPVSYNQRWWHFYLAGLSEFTSTLFNKYYWLYGTSDFGENFEYQGKGSINDLLDVHFATASTIIYSTTDYPVTIVTADGTQTDIIPGDQYTYDENVDPTTNEYNPLENFVPTSPSQTILGDVDFDEINKTFEENKDILNIENASWLFTANNQLTNYFIGFLSLLIVFLIISRILGG